MIAHLREFIKFRNIIAYRWRQRGPLCSLEDFYGVVVARSDFSIRVRYRAWLTPFLGSYCFFIALGLVQSEASCYPTGKRLQFGWFIPPVRCCVALIRNNLSDPYQVNTFELLTSKRYFTRQKYLRRPDLTQFKNYKTTIWLEVKIKPRTSRLNQTACHLYSRGRQK